MNSLFRPTQTLLLSFLGLLAFSIASKAQSLQVTDAVNGPYNPQSLISNVFLGAGVEVTSIQFNGDPLAVGYFSGGSAAIGLDRGILLTNGNASQVELDGIDFADVDNAGGSSEPSLDAIATDPINDVAVYTITFIPNSDTLRFRYCFASEEYPEFACSTFNDIFGFFIQGPGYPVFTNIAKIPNTNLPVSINNIHPVNPNFPPCPPVNLQYYNDNDNSNFQPVYDGYTDVFTALAVVTPCQPYTIKLAIADVDDDRLDSGVFLEAKSFGTSALFANVVTPSSDGVLAEGCTPGEVTFTIPDYRAQNYNVIYNVFGSATPGLDYPAIPNNLFIPAGQLSITVPINALEDNMVEPLESIGIAVQVDPCNWDTIYLYIRDKILQAPILNDTSVCVANTPVQFDATVQTPVSNPPTFTNQTDITIPNNGSPINSSINVFGVQPSTIGPGVIRSVCINVDHDQIEDVDVYLISPGGIVLELTTDNGGDGNDYTGTCFTAAASTLISFPGPFAPPSAAPFTGDWLPEGPWSDLWGEPTNGNWRLRISDDELVNVGGQLLDWSITFEPEYNVTYTWSPATGLSCTDCPNPIATVPQTTAYAVTVTDSYGCTVADNIALSVGVFTPSTSILQDIKCFGQSGSIQAAAPGNNAYSWSNGQNTATISNLGPGTYTVTVTSQGASCTSTASVTLTQPDELFATASPHAVTCFGLSTGTAAVYPTGGIAPYTFMWSNGLQVDSISNLLPGPYTVTVTDANGCQEIANMNVGEPTAIQILTALNRSPSCFGLSDGQLTTYAVGGTTPFDFVWNTGQINQGITNITAGIYTVTATDGNGCSQVSTITVTEPPVLTSFATPQEVKCFDKNTGAFHVDAAGGTPPYSANWTGPNGYVGNGLNPINLFAGQYSATVTDAHGCSNVLTAQLNQPTELVAALPEIADTICFFGANGTATVLASGGTSPYAYLWDANSQTSQMATGLASNEYHVTITDANGCTTTGKTFVMQQQELNTFGQAQASGCHNGFDGTAAVISIYYGATPANLNDFSFTWNTTPQQVGLNATGLQGGQTYILTATDVLGCTATASVPVGNPLQLETSVTGISNVECNGDATGRASAQADGGTPPYTWFWNGGTNPSDSVALGLKAGIYRVTITDSHGCPGTASVTIAEPPLLKVTTTPTAVKCFGESSGSALATPSGGTPPYQFVWASGVQTSSIQDLVAGFYTLTVTDANGCTTPGSVEVGQPSEAVGGSASMEEPTCNGGHDGRILMTATGGTPPYRYGLDNNPVNGSPNQIGIVAGTYVPKIVDKNGCELTLAPIVVTQPDPVLVDLGPDIHIVFGQDTQLLALVQNAVGLVQYAWSQEDSIWLSCLDCSNPSVYALEFPTYFNIVVTDSMGCQDRDQILISVEKLRKVYVPTGFTPNGDFVNDLLLVHGQNNSKVLDFKVFDRWGEMVFQLKDFAFNDEKMGWDGNFREQPCDPGVYVWILEVEYVDGVREVFKGNTTLIR